MHVGRRRGDFSDIWVLEHLHPPNCGFKFFEILQQIMIVENNNKEG
jgi:hypothetical protein